MLSTESNAIGMLRSPLGDAASASGATNAAVKQVSTHAPTVFCPSAQIEKCLRPLTGRKQ